MSEFLFEAAKTIGSLSGIFASAFLLWDRYIKHFPVAVIVATPFMEGSKNIVPILLIRNVSDRPILLSWKDGKLDQLRVGKEQSLEGVVRSVLNGETPVSLGPHAEARFPLFHPRNYDAIDADNVLEMIIKWRFAQPRIWKVDRTLNVWIRKRDLEALLEGYLEWRSEIVT